MDNRGEKKFQRRETCEKELDLNNIQVSSLPYNVFGLFILSLLLRRATLSITKCISNQETQVKIVFLL